MLKESYKSNITGLIESYRIISIFLTLSIYMINGIFEQYAVSAMLLLALCITVSALLLMYLYRLSLEVRWKLNFLLLVEITGISVLMVLTGGLDSPFIWYFLNPLLIISCYMQAKEKAFYLIANFMLLSAIGYYQAGTPELKDYLLSHSNIILSYVLILILVNILFDYNRLITQKKEELREANEKLESSHAKIKQLITNIMFMYEAMQAISNQRDRGEVLHILLDFTGKIFSKSAAFFLPNDYDCGRTECTERLVSLKTINGGLRESLVDTIKEHYSVISKDDISLYTLETGKRVVLIKVSNIRDYGILGLVLPEREDGWNKDEYSLGLRFFSRLGAMLLEKIEVETVNYELAIADEQNRIADDIHDSVAQRLFAMSCMSYDTIKKWERIADNQKKEQMTLIMETVQSSLKDLRSTIYNLSHKKQQIELFKESLSSYLLDMERLSGTKIHLDLDGAEDHLSTGAKKALYRIIIESTGNAIRHGKCQNVWVKLNSGDTNTFLTIKDDGLGFDLAEAEMEKQGMGLYNIKSLVRIFNGSIDITSDQERGTIIEAIFPNKDIMQKLA
ncbi:MAG: sensor histidine kinase [Dethiobacteria bacterium]|jgi:NarL family two-component system sensor histidine kinase LiaS